MNAYEILGVSPIATKEEIYGAYRKLALKYHPDKNRGNEEWAKQKFIEVSEAYQSLSKSAPRKKFEFSNKPGSDKFKEFEEMLREVERDFDKIGKDLDEQEKSLNQEREKVQNEAIRNMEERLDLSNISASDLNSSLWIPYGNWKEKVRNSIDSSLELFLSNMRIEIEKAKVKKMNDNYNNTHSNFPNKNFPPKNSGWNKNYSTPLTSSEKIEQLEKEIEYNKKYLLKTVSQEEKIKCQKIISELENQLRRLRTPYDNNGEKDKRTELLKTEINQLRNNKPWDPWKKQENQKKIAEKEQELSELRKSNKDNNYVDYDDWDQEQLTSEFKRLKSENNTAELSEKVSQLEKMISQLVREIQELRSEIQELKEQGNSSSEYQTYYLERQEGKLSEKESRLNQLVSVFEVNNNNNNNNNNNKPLPILPIIGTVGVVGLLGAIIVYKVKKSKIKR